MRLYESFSVERMVSALQQGTRSAAELESLMKEGRLYKYTAEAKDWPTNLRLCVQALGAGANCDPVALGDAIIALHDDLEDRIKALRLAREEMTRLERTDYPKPALGTLKGKA